MGCGGYRDGRLNRDMWGGGVIRWMSTNSAILHLDSSSRRHEMSVDSFPFIRLVPFLSFCEQRQMEGVIQSDQTPETPGSEGGKGHTKQEAPWRPPSRTKCVDELMHSGLLGKQEMKGKMSIQREGTGIVCRDVCVCVCANFRCASGSTCLKA